MLHKSRLEAAHRVGQIVRIHHRIDEGYVDGYVAAIGADCFLLEVFDETLRLNGFSCLRYADVADSEFPSSREAFLSKVVRLRNLQRAPAPNLDFATLQSAIGSASRLEPLVSLHAIFDDGDSDDPSLVCFVGKILACDSEKTSLLCMSTDAAWDDEPYALPTAAIYRLDLGGGYEEALLLASRS